MRPCKPARVRTLFSNCLILALYTDKSTEDPPPELVANCPYLVTSTDVAEMKVSNLQKIGDGLYTCTVYFYQYFIGKSGDNNVIYKDKTNKRVQCYIIEEETEDGYEYIVLLGDIFADTTESF